jgi:membrane-bound lytic murein transglycosylase A
MNKIKLGRVLFVILMVIFLLVWLRPAKQFWTHEAPPETPVTLPEEPAQAPPVHWEAEASFDAMPGWSTEDLRPSLQAFQVSCRVFLKQAPDKEVGNKTFPMKAKDWKPVCRAALALSNPSETDVRAFFEAWFDPGMLHDDKPLEGLFTGYYAPVFEGSYTKTDVFNVPVYALPKHWVTLRLKDFDPDASSNKVLVGRVEGHRVYPFHTRAEINQGAIGEKADVLVWMKSQFNRMVLEIQGSGLIKLPDGKEIFLGYAGQNGAAYTSIAGVLIRQGVMTRDNASMKRIEEYFEANPDVMQSVLDQNQSFIFFEKQNTAKARGAQGVFLTPGYSLAVDRKWIPLGMPLWVNTTRPGDDLNTSAPLTRLFVAQDTGGAITGPVRGDVFWGAGEDAGAIAGHMRNKGVYWLMRPRETPKEVVSEPASQ